MRLYCNLSIFGKSNIAEEERKKIKKEVNRTVMGLFDVFKKDKKKKKASKCALTGTMLYYGEGRLLTTDQVVSSKKFWESIMTEPEAMAYTINHFKNNDKSALQMRGIIFEKYAERQEPWIVSEDCLRTYGIEAENSREYATQWWESEGAFRPPSNGDAKTVLSNDSYEAIKHYAIWKAGESRVA